MKSLVVAAGAAFALAACGSGSGNPSEGALGAASDPSYLQVNLMDAPLPNVKSVYINVLSIEVFTQRHGHGARVLLANDVGLIDLLKLQNGVFQLLGNLTLPPETTIQQLRFILGSGNNVIMNDGTVCPLATPSAQQSGIKLPFTPALTTQHDVAYQLMLDFQVDQSVVILGSGSCVLNPVIKVAAATEVPVEPPDVQPGSPLPVTWTPMGSPVPAGFTGASDGTFSDNTSPSDPPVVSGGTLWSM